MALDVRAIQKYVPLDTPDASQTTEWVPGWATSSRMVATVRPSKSEIVTVTLSRVPTEMDRVVRGLNGFGKFALKPSPVGSTPNDAIPTDKSDCDFSV
jgi:hypothetical protein